jgi:exodeoxyribonuclease VIII
MCTYRENAAINASALKQILKSPAKYKYGLTAKQTTTAALKLGSAAHCAILEPQEFEARYIVKPEGLSLATKEGKEWKANVFDREILSCDEMEAVTGMLESIQAHKAFRLFETGLAEFEIYTEIGGTPAKAKVDFMNDNGVIVDLKTTDDASPRGFSQSVFKYDYALQAAWYIDTARAAGYDITHFIFVAVEKTAPYLTAIYQLDDDAIEYGRKQYKEALRIYRECNVTGDWYGYSDSIETISLPNWLVGAYV